jgi:hypothetical protein
MLRRWLSAISGTALAFLMIGPGYAFEENIVAAWTFDEGSGVDIHDVSGNGNDGLLIGGAQWVDGKFGDALDFDGATGYIEIPFDESMRVINQGDFTLAAWFRPDAAPVKYLILQQGDMNGTGRSWLFIHQDVGEIQSFLGGDRTQSGVNVKAEEWYHAAVVVTEGGNTDTVQLYVNGKLSGDPFQKGMEDCEGTFFIGRHKNASDFMDGIMDDVVLINKALSQVEINSLMTKGIIKGSAVEPMGKLAINWGNIKVNTQ